MQVLLSKRPIDPEEPVPVKHASSVQSNQHKSQASAEDGIKKLRLSSLSMAAKDKDPKLRSCVSGQRAADPEIVFLQDVSQEVETSSRKIMSGTGEPKKLPKKKVARASTRKIEKLSQKIRQQSFLQDGLCDPKDSSSHTENVNIDTVIEDHMATLTNDEADEDYSESLGDLQQSSTFTKEPILQINTHARVLEEFFSSNQNSVDSSAEQLQFHFAPSICLMMADCDALEAIIEEMPPSSSEQTAARQDSIDSTPKGEGLPSSRSSRKQLIENRPPSEDYARSIENFYQDFIEANLNSDPGHREELLSDFADFLKQADPDHLHQQLLNQSYSYFDGLGREEEALEKRKELISLLEDLKTLVDRLQHPLVYEFAAKAVKRERSFFHQSVSQELRQSFASRSRKPTSETIQSEKQLGNFGEEQVQNIHIEFSLDDTMSNQQQPPSESTPDILAKETERLLISFRNWEDYNRSLQVHQDSLKTKQAEEEAQAQAAKEQKRNRPLSQGKSKQSLNTNSQSGPSDVPSTLVYKSKHQQVYSPKSSLIEDNIAEEDEKAPPFPEAFDINSVDQDPHREEDPIEFQISHPSTGKAQRNFHQRFWSMENEENNSSAYLRINQFLQQPQVVDQFMPPPSLEHSASHPTVDQTVLEGPYCLEQEDQFEPEEAVSPLIQQRPSWNIEAQLTSMRAPTTLSGQLPAIQEQESESQRGQNEEEERASMRLVTFKSESQCLASAPDTRLKVVAPTEDWSSSGAIANETPTLELKFGQQRHSGSNNEDSSYLRPEDETIDVSTTSMGVLKPRELAPSNKRYEVMQIIERSQTIDSPKRDLSNEPGPIEEEDLANYDPQVTTKEIARASTTFEDQFNQVNFSNPHSVQPEFQDSVSDIEVSMPFVQQVPVHEELPTAQFVSKAASKASIEQTKPRKIFTSVPNYYKAMKPKRDRSRETDFERSVSSLLAKQKRSRADKRSSSYLQERNEDFQDEARSRMKSEFQEFNQHYLDTLLKQQTNEKAYFEQILGGSVGSNGSGLGGKKRKNQRNKVSPSSRWRTLAEPNLSEMNESPQYPFFNPNLNRLVSSSQSKFLESTDVGGNDNTMTSLKLTEQPDFQSALEGFMGPSRYHPILGSSSGKSTTLKSEGPSKLAKNSKMQRVRSGVQRQSIQLGRPTSSIRPKSAAANVSRSLQLRKKTNVSGKLNIQQFKNNLETLPTSSAFVGQTSAKLSTQSSVNLKASIRKAVKTTNSIQRVLSSEIEPEAPNKPIVNRAHLFQGTISEESQSMFKKEPDEFSMWMKGQEPPCLKKAQNKKFAFKKPTKSSMHFTSSRENSRASRTSQTLKNRSQAREIKSQAARSRPFSNLQSAAPTQMQSPNSISLVAHPIPPSDFSTDGREDGRLSKMLAGLQGKSLFIVETSDQETLNQEFQQFLRWRKAQKRTEVTQLEERIKERKKRQPRILAHNSQSSADLRGNFRQNAGKHFFMKMKRQEGAVPGLK